MHRRDFLQSAILALGAACEAHGERGWGLPAAPPSRFKLAAISDGFSQDFEKALKSMKRYGLSWVEIRGLWGKYNTEATPEEIKRVKGLLDQYNFKCSVVDSGFYKCVLPGTNAVSIEGGYHTPYSGQMDLLKHGMDRCHA